MLAIAEGRSVRTIDQSSRGKQHGVASRRVPFAGRRSAGIDVGSPLRDYAEFQRGTDRNVTAGADRLLQIVDRGLVEVRLGSDRGELLAAAAGPDRLAAFAVVDPCSGPDVSAVQLLGRRSEDHAQ